jgi:hypothetical protein
VFSAESTTRIIRSYFDTIASAEDPHDLAREIQRAVITATKIFHAAGTDPFAVRAGSRARFNRLRATTSLIMATVINRARTLRPFEDDVVIAAVARVTSLVPYPGKQQTSTIWAYQATSVCALADALGLTREDLAAVGLERLTATMRLLCGT